MISWSLIFQILLPPLRYSSQKRKNVIERGIRNIVTFVIQRIASKIFGKNTEPLVISKRLNKVAVG